MRRTKAKAEETRNRILTAAEHVFFEKGVSNATLEDVASVAGVTRGAIYWHFQNKADIFLELYKAVPLPDEELLRDEIENVGIDILAHIEAVAGDWLDVMACDEQRQRILTILLRCDYTSDLAPVLGRQQEIDDEHTRFLEDAFGKAASRGALSGAWTPSSAARAMRWMIKGLCSEWLLFGRRFDLAGEGRQGLARLFGCFRREDAQAV
ncbi:TetR family transcriptional regulator [Rhizobium sp. DKSPLA3]|uniref:TetR family transcriptional regulator n=1 Tax=Rhizobium quercicola TaxID=2901226 RepID=A0A9X1T148_9HYPH|nr:TetR family transcriptional regulator [Rhizobium quercicola]MCD7110157.1 TetR family transcriptional regulator [Rhizobium quercicola]